MPEDSLHAFRAFYEQGSAAFNKGDLQAALGALPADLEWHPPSENPEQGVRHGPEEIKAWFEEMRSIFDQWRVEPIDFERIAENAVLVHHIIRGTSRGAGVPVEVETYEVWELAPVEPGADEVWAPIGGRPLRVRQFSSHEQALLAASG